MPEKKSAGESLAQEAIAHSGPPKQEFSSHKVSEDEIEQMAEAIKSFNDREGKETDDILNQVSIKELRKMHEFLYHFKDKLFHVLMNRMVEEDIKRNRGEHQAEHSDHTPES